MEVVCLQVSLVERVGLRGGLGLVVFVEGELLEACETGGGCSELVHELGGRCDLGDGVSSVRRACMDVDTHDVWTRTH